MLEDKGSERAVLSGLCQFGSEGYLEVSDIINEDCFLNLKNQAIFKCLSHLFDLGHKKVDIAGIFSAANSLSYESLLASNVDETFIRSLFNFPIKLDNLRLYTIKLINLSIARKTKQKLKEAICSIEDITGDEETYKILDIAETPYSDLMKELGNTEEVSEIGEGIEEYIENKIENPIQSVGIPSPFTRWNAVIGGGMRTGVHLVAARFKSGKSSFAKEIGIHVSKNLNIPVLYLDSEMQKDEQRDRIIASIAEMEISRIEKGNFSQQEKDKVRYVAKTIKSLPFTHRRISGKQFSEVLSLMRRWINHKVGYNDEGVTNPHLIIYDYFKLMNTEDRKDMKEYEAMGYQICALHDFCAEYKTPVLSFVQTNRDGIGKETTDVIAQSDRLGWNAISLSLWKRKTPEEKGNDGPKNGTHKLVPLEGRFMQRLDDGDWINFHFDEARSKITELSTRYESANFE